MDISWIKDQNTLATYSNGYIIDIDGNAAGTYRNGRIFNTSDSIIAYYSNGYILKKSHLHNWMKVAGVTIRQVIGFLGYIRKELFTTVSSGSFQRIMMFKPANSFSIMKTMNALT